MTDATIEPGADPGTVPNRHVHLDPAPDRETAERRRRAVLAGHGGDAEAARSLAVDPEAVVRAAALGALNRTGTLTDDGLARGLTAPHPTVRLRALEILGGPTPLSGLLTRLLVDLLVDPIPEVVETACWAAGEHPEAADQLVDSVVAVAGTGPDGDRPGHPDHLCREAAATRDARRRTLQLNDLSNMKGTLRRHSTAPQVRRALRQAHRRRPRLAGSTSNLPRRLRDARSARHYGH